ncbi:hypothetical protein BOX15_Mlig001893g4 [Macrostomum lignano]|uniref:non-specific serine/threonine protein kinase n=2 Tax=Macrostomum lignano TaxID=282301 RepID=A0A1I8J6D0_9PLAT|nr:hypothetical protein BOX15_Mlig001893g4 [Macrostomum lignano]
MSEEVRDGEQTITASSSQQQNAQPPAQQQQPTAAQVGHGSLKPLALHNTASVASFGSVVGGAAPASAAGAAASTDVWPKGKVNYVMDKQLGSGATSRVYKAFCPLKNNAEIAVKVVNLDSSSVSMDELHRETQGMKKLRHENIVAYYGSFIEDQFLYILMDLCERSLLDMINHVKATRDITHGVLDECTIATIMREAIKGLQYIHENGIVHRDIKCGNILLKKDGSVLIADFGVTAFINTNPLTAMSVNPVSRHTFVGTPCWMAPEVMEQRQVGYTQKADIWSVGITALELVTGSAPYAKFPPVKVIVLTLNNDPPNLTSVEEKAGQFSAYGQKFRKFVSACLQRNDGERPSAKQLLHHSFIRGKAKDKEVIVKALLSGDTPLPSVKVKRRSADALEAGEGCEYDSDSDADEQDFWDFSGDATLTADSRGADTAAVAAAAVSGSAASASETLTAAGSATAASSVKLIADTGSAASATTAAGSATSSEAQSDNADARLEWHRKLLGGQPGQVCMKLRLRKRKDADPVAPGSDSGAASGSGAPKDPSGSGAAAGSSANSSSSAAGSTADSSSETPGLPELQDITFDLTVGKDRANGITMELVESELVRMHDLVVISHALQTLIDQPWQQQRVIPLNSPLPNGVYPDQAEFVGFAGLSVVSVRLVRSDASEETVNLATLSAAAAQ